MGCNCPCKPARLLARLLPSLLSSLAYASRAAAMLSFGNVANSGSCMHLIKVKQVVGVGARLRGGAHACSLNNGQALAVHKWQALAAHTGQLGFMQLNVCLHIIRGLSCWCSCRAVQLFGLRSHVLSHGCAWGERGGLAASKQLCCWGGTFNKAWFHVMQHAAYSQYPCFCRQINEMSRIILYIYHIVPPP